VYKREKGEELVIRNQDQKSRSAIWIKIKIEIFFEEENFQEKRLLNKGNYDRDLKTYFLERGKEKKDGKIQKIYLIFDSRSFSARTAPVCKRIFCLQNKL